MCFLFPFLSFMCFLFPFFSFMCFLFLFLQVQVCHRYAVHPYNEAEAAEHARVCRARHDKLQQRLGSVNVECGICLEKVGAAWPAGVGVGWGDVDVGPFDSMVLLGECGFGCAVRSPGPMNPN